MKRLVNGGIMLLVKKLKSFTMENEMSFGLNGFYTDELYEVTKNVTHDDITINLKLKKLDQPMKKEWPHLETDMDMYNEIIEQGYSLGAYKNDKLVGVIIAENRKWNNTLWIAEIVISESCRRDGIGSILMDDFIQLAKENNFRVIGLETQSINLPAINFYRKNGFEIDGLDLSLYSNRDVENKEFALYMKKKLY